MRDERSEQLDDTIDRVAAGMTFVAHDSTFASRVADRIDEGASSWWMPSRALVAAAAAVIVIVLARAAVDRFTPPAPAPVQVAVTPAAPPIAAAPAQPGRDLDVKSAVPLQARTVLPPPAEQRPRLITHERVVPQIPALEGPGLLSVDRSNPSSNLIPLTITPVELAPLDLANLALTESGVPENPKE
jgi:hypothetical protein